MIDKKEILERVRSGKKPKILVIGDIMADRYVWGSASRISPEAPVPVVAVKNETITLGGAANVAQNLSKLHANVSLSGVTGKDAMQPVILKQLKKEKIDTRAIIEDSTRPSTLKTRIMAGTHQLLRVDRETNAEINEDIQQRLLSRLQAQIQAADIVLLSDYNKGLLTKNVTAEIIERCKGAGKKLIVDPKGLHYEKYKGAWMIKPNKRELAEATVSEQITTEEVLIAAAKRLLSKTKAQHLVVTRSEEGISLISKKSAHHFAVKAKEVFDVTGAGDTVFATLGYFVALGFELKTACELANYAAAIAVSRVGSVAVTLDEILSLMDAHES
ncbi:D-glycero-beta-D-manno-heptose-7-phosphate kinase [Niabella insulamsoli]|uniref:D-glycero-beta-D-manno-heptose-7-phosphate kinase n=1 Tax=Niabella insulamsoli TaxID=3144874 RepID=UPI0031FCEEF2